MGIASLTALLLLVAYGMLVEPRLVLDEERLSVTLPRFPADAPSPTVAVFSDIQLGMWFANTGMVEDIVERVVEERPSAALIVGDFVYSHDPAPAEQADRWLTVTTTAFRTWFGAELRSVPPVPHGLEPAAAPALEPAPDATDETRAFPANPERRVAALAVVWVLLWGLLLTAGWFVTQVLPGSVVGRLDEAVVRWVVEHRTPTWTTVAALVGSLGGTATVAGLAVVVAVVALATTRRWRPVLFLGAVLVGEVTLFLATASTVGRTRPTVPHIGPPLPPTSSFPSGHVAAAISLYGATAVLVVVWTRRWRWLVVAAAALVATLVATSRIYFGDHYPSDVLASSPCPGWWAAGTSCCGRKDGRSRAEDARGVRGGTRTPFCGISAPLGGFMWLDGSQGAA